LKGHAKCENRKKPRFRRPPQEGTADSVALHDDALAAGVDAVANALGLKRVGCIFSHPPREAGFVFSGAEVSASPEDALFFFFSSNDSSSND
jgi:hypothetical protein